MQGCTDFEDIRCVNTYLPNGDIHTRTQYATYAEAALALGLIQADTEWTDCILEGNITMQLGT